MRFQKRQKPDSKPNPVTILYDNHEKHPWMFLKQDWPMKRVHLKVGDYTIEGYEDKVAIEKKSGIEELLRDLTAKYRPTFVRFLRRLSKVPIKVIVVEGSLSDVPVAVKAIQLKSKGKSELTKEAIYYWLAQITVKYKIPVIFTGNSWKTPVWVVKHLITETIKEL